jgi:hypothetical protein
LFAGVMHDMEIPKEPRFVTHAVEDIVREIIDKEQYNPRPPGVRRKLVRG